MNSTKKYWRKSETKSGGNFAFLLFWHFLNGDFAVEQDAKERKERHLDTNTHKMKRCLPRLLVKELQNKKPDHVWQRILDSYEFQVLRTGRTDAPNQHAYCNNHQPGIYLCRCCRVPLYASTKKFSCSCGWPAFSESLENHVSRRQEPAPDDRIELICTSCESHLGHVFKGEGWRDANDQVVEERHCVNGTSLMFRREEEREAMAYEPGKLIPPLQLR